MNIIRSAGIIVYKEQENDQKQIVPYYLLLLYPGGYWEFPKGKLELGETETGAAIRELKEETGLEADLQDKFQETIKYSFKNRQGNVVDKYVDFFIGKARGSKVVLSSEHRDFAWLPFEQATVYIQHNNARELLKKADTFLAHSRTESTHHG
jgi:8-oxo-dGTP pyrophosphatase MutT (NUDIX family)